MDGSPKTGYPLRAWRIFWSKKTAVPWVGKWWNIMHCLIVYATLFWRRLSTWLELRCAFICFLRSHMLANSSGLLDFKPGLCGKGWASTRFRRHFFRPSDLSGEWPWAGVYLAGNYVGGVALGRCILAKRLAHRSIDHSWNIYRVGQDHRSHIFPAFSSMTL